MQRAAGLGYAALALTDDCSVAGVVRAHEAALACGLKLVLGAQFAVSLSSDAPMHLPAAAGHFTAVVLVRNLAGWGQLCELITAARRAAPKGQYRMAWHAPLWQARWATLTDCEVLLQFPLAINFEAVYAVSMGLRVIWHKMLAGGFLAAGSGRCAAAPASGAVGALHGLELVAVGDVHLHVRSRKPCTTSSPRCGWGSRSRPAAGPCSPMRSCTCAAASGWPPVPVGLARAHPGDCCAVTSTCANCATTTPGNRAAGQTPAQTPAAPLCPGLTVRYPQGHRRRCRSSWRTSWP